jgi:hypothetical protein
MKFHGILPKADRGLPNPLIFDFDLNHIGYQPARFPCDGGHRQFDALKPPTFLPRYPLSLGKRCYFVPSQPTIFKSRRPRCALPTTVMTQKNWRQHVFASGRLVTQSGEHKLFVLIRIE